eukprot:scaffold16790_cov204-Skeletonema_marinoi.AAC.7
MCPRNEKDTGGSVLVQLSFLERGFSKLMSGTVLRPQWYGNCKLDRKAHPNTSQLPYLSRKLYDE